MQAPQGATSTGFRGDIQGLRAIAVGTVMVAHAGLGPFAGGFVGVDVFFVISGFLITQLLINEAGRSGTVSMSGFYSRRARRILPAASVVLVATVVASLLFLSVLDALDLMKDALWAALFAANVRFAVQGVDYFAQDANPSPIQHYWSLAVEEQFYLLWPLVILLLCKLATRVSIRRRLFIAIVAISLASLAWSVFRTAQEPNSAYFSSLTRGWELGVGAMCALAAHRGTTGWPAWLRSLLAGGGLLAILVSCLAYTEATPFPGYAAALPVLGTAATIFAGSGTHDRPSLVARGLSWKPLRIVGDWSYSLYLWHWPLLIVSALYLGRDLTTLEALTMLAVTFVLSWATYRWVETPFRKGLRWAPPKSLLLYPVSLALVMGTAGAGWVVTDYRAGEHGHNPAITLTNFGVGDPAKFTLDDDPTVGLVEASVIAARHHMAVPSNLTPDLLDIEADVPDVGACEYSQMVTTLCPRGDTEGTKTMVVLGDSHGRMWMPALDTIAQRNGYVVYYLVKPQCTAALVDVARVGNHQPWPECEQFHAWVHDRLVDLKPDLIIVSTSPAVSGIYTDDGTLVDTNDAMVPLMRQGFADLFADVKPLTKRLVVIGDVPKLKEPPSICLTQGDPDLGDCTYRPESFSADVRDASREEAQAAGAQFIDPTRWICFERVCPSVVGSYVTYRDQGHLTTPYVAALTDPLARALELK